MPGQRPRGGRDRRRSGWVAVLVIAATVMSIVVARAARRRRLEASAPAEVGFMLAMHNAFRRDLAVLERLASGARDVGTGDELRRSWESFRERLHRHHIAEDEDLWPVLRARLNTPDDLARVDQMVDEHQALSVAMDAVDRSIGTPPSGGGEPDVATAVGRLGRLVHDHLDHEEREVLPLIEEHLSGADWRAFLTTERRQTPLRDRPDFLGWVLDEADPADAGAVLAELPPPGRLAYRYVIGPRYRSTHGHSTGTAVAG